MFIFAEVDGTHRMEVDRILAAQWGSIEMVVRGEVVDMSRQNGILAYSEGKIVGLLVYRIQGEMCEILSLDSFQEGIGIGTGLIGQVIGIARRAGCVKIKLITTNDNVNAIRFYQKRGFDMVRIYRNALEVSRKLKPAIPLVGENGIPIRHEIEFELLL